MVVVAIAIAIVVGVIMWRTKKQPAPTTKPIAAASGSATMSSGNQRPTLGSSVATTDHATPDFIRTRTEAMVRFQGDVVTRLNACAGPSGKPPTPRNVRFVMEWQAERSRPQLQMFTVRDAILDDAAGISDVSRQCIERMRGMPIEVASADVPADSHLFEQHLMVPIP